MEVTTQHTLEDLAYYKYTGQLIEDGFMDSKKAADSLIGFDDSLRYFLFQENPSLQQSEFEIPVRIEKGSWITWIGGIVVLGIGTYSVTAAKKLAENDFKDVKTKDIILGAFRAMKGVIKIAKHLGGMKKRNFETTELKEGNTVIGIKDEKGKVIFVNYRHLELYVNCPDKLFSKFTKAIEDERALTIGINPMFKITDEDNEDVKVSLKDKYLFTDVEKDEEIFPELKHGNYVELKGRLTRGNENSNTLGFQYKNHILTCEPTNGNIKKYKSLLFTDCLVKGYIDRMDKFGNAVELRPKIRYLEFLPLEGSESPNLFS